MIGPSVIGQLDKPITSFNIITIPTTSKSQKPKFYTKSQNGESQWSDFVNHSYDYRLNWSPRSLITITLLVFFFTFFGIQQVFRAVFK